MDDFLKERDEVFASMNKERIVEYCNKYNITIPEKEDVFWAGVHKTICNLFLNPDTKITMEQYNESYDWLKEHGYSASIN
jgi:hypothetical protein